MDETLSFVRKRAGIIDALVISGGEPTLQKDLEVFVKRIKAMGYLVKLDTNGSNPDMVKKLINGKLIDYIAIDLKCPFDRYVEICRNDDGNAVRKAIMHTVESGIDYDIRTTMIPQGHQRKC